MGISIALRELMPIDMAKEITMKGEMIKADDALSIGLLNEVIPADADVVVAGIARLKDMNILQETPEHARRIKASMLAGRVSRFGNDRASTKPMNVSASKPETSARPVQSLRGAWDANGVVVVELSNANLPQSVGEAAAFAKQLKGFTKGKKLCRGIILDLATTAETSPDVATAHAIASTLLDLPVPVFAIFPEKFEGNDSVWLLTAGADFRYAHADAKLEVDLGELKANASAFVCALVEESLRRDGKVSGAAQAKDIGLVTHVSASPLEDAKKAATRIARGAS